MGNLKLALETVYLNELNSIPSEQELKSRIIVSTKFDRRMKKLIREQATIAPNRRIKRMLLVAVLTALMASIMSVQAIREPIISFVMEIYEECSSFIFNSTNGHTPGTDEFFIPDPPEGYKETRREEFKNVAEVEYSGENGEFLSYTQYRYHNASLSVDTENAPTDIEKILGCDVFVYSNKGHTSMIWNDDVFVYELSTTADISELRSITEKIIEKIK